MLLLDTNILSELRKLNSDKIHPRAKMGGSNAFFAILYQRNQFNRNQNGHFVAGTKRPNASQSVAIVV